VFSTVHRQPAVFPRTNEPTDSCVPNEQIPGKSDETTAVTEYSMQQHYQLNNQKQLNQCKPRTWPRQLDQYALLYNFQAVFGYNVYWKLPCVYAIVIWDSLDLSSD